MKFNEIQVKSVKFASIHVLFFGPDFKLCSFFTKEWPKTDAKESYLPVVELLSLNFKLNQLFEPRLDSKPSKIL